MQRVKRFHRTRALVVGTALVAAAIVGSAPSASATSGGSSDSLVFVPYHGQTFTIWRNGNVVQPVHFTTQSAIEGNFSAAPGEDTFLYNFGSGPDGILHVTPSGTTATTSFRSESISGDYIDVVGDFDGNAIDDIVWYAPGTRPDYLWLFQPDGSHTQVNLTINGSDYRPRTVTSNGDGYDDILWYGPGSVGDSVWRFGPGGSHTSAPLTIGGNYEPVSGYFGVAAEGSPQQRLIFLAQSGNSYIWTFDTGGGHTSAGLGNLGSSVTPIVGNFSNKLTDDVLLYRAGTASERYIGFTPSGQLQQFEPPSVKGSYDPVVGDFDGNGYADIAWASGGKATLWKFNGGGFTQASIVTNTTNTTAITSRSGIVLA